jgi:hypothetical protein
MRGDTVPTVLQQRNVPEAMRSLSTLAKPDYVDLFTVTWTAPAHEGRESSSVRPRLFVLLDLPLVAIDPSERSPVVHSGSLRPTLRCGEHGPTRFPGLRAHGGNTGSRAHG